MQLAIYEDEGRVVVLLLCCCCGRKLKPREASALILCREVVTGVVGVRRQWMKGHRIGNSYLHWAATDILYLIASESINDFLRLGHGIVADL